MKIKLIGAVAAITATVFALQPVEAKSKFWAQNNLNSNAGCGVQHTGMNGWNGGNFNAYNGFNGYNGYNGYNNVGFNGYNNVGWNGYNQYPVNNGIGNHFGWQNHCGFGGNTSANIDRYQDSIASRIQRGITSGRLTQSEANRLLAMQTRINQLETNYRASGNILSYRERTRLSNELNKLSQRLRREMTDRQVM